MTAHEFLSSYKVPEGKVLVLRTADAERKSYNGFQWPDSGYVEAPDWKPTEQCGNGLHGALKGEGYGSLFAWSLDAVWQVVEVDEVGIIDLRGKVKFKCGNVVYSGSREVATAIIYEIYHTAIIGGTATAGNFGTATAGDEGIIQIKHWDGYRYRIMTAYVGEDGIEPNVAYKLDDNGKFIKA